MTFRHGTNNEIGPNESMRRGMQASGLNRPATDRASLRTASGSVFDMHGPEEVFVHVPHITAAEAGQAQIQGMAQ